MMLVLLPVLLAALSWAIGGAEANTVAMSQGYRLPNTVQYLALAPKKVYPNQEFLVHITLLSMPYSSLMLRTILSQDGREYASTADTFYRKGTHQLQMKVPITVTPGKHKLSVEGLIGAENAVFRNHTVLTFDTKYVSIFIQTDRPVYYSSITPNNDDDWAGNYEWPAIDKVKFRIVGTTPDLTPISGPITVLVKDGIGNLVIRYLQKQLNFGIYEDSFRIAYPCHTGKWVIAVEAFNHVYEQEIQVINWYPTRFEVNVTTPMYIFNSEWGIAGLLQAKYLTGKDVYSNSTTITLKVRDKDGNFLDGELNQKFGYMQGLTPFSFALSEITETFGDVSGHELLITSSVWDWYWMERQSGFSVTRVIKDAIKLKVLGPKFRTFKPRVPFTVYVAVTRSDGTPYQGFLNRQLIVQAIHTGKGAQSYPEKKILVPRSSIVEYEVYPGEHDRRIQIRAWHPVTGSAVDIDCYRYWSPTNRYISITLSTEVPKVDEYGVFTVRTNFFTPEINYMIMAGGNVLLGSQIMMMSQQKTFSIAIGRKMAPRARLLVFAVIDGEILVDGINFFVQDTRLSKASLTMNKGKDFIGDYIEIIGQGVAGAFLSTTGLDYEFYKRGAATFFNQEKIIRELVSYDEPNEGPYHYSWFYNDERWEETVYFTAPTAGVDHLTTFNISGLSALSDMNLTATPESHNCNRSLGFGRCLSGECFELRHMCDGKVECTLDAFDELNCQFDRLPPRRPHDLENIHYTSRYFFTNEWLWHTTYIKHRGQVEWQTEVPENYGAYVAGAFVLDRTEGLAIAPVPIQHDASRVFYMVSEYPSSIRRGEQVGISLTLFNNWDEDLEVIVTLHGSDDYRFIHVEDYGLVSAYSPRTSHGDMQTMVELRPGENKLLHIPVVPVLQHGHIQVHISAYCFLRIDKEVIDIDITYDGVTNDDQIPYLVDLVNQGSVIIPDFDIPIPDQFFLPNQRDLLYIPGSNMATVSVWGNVVAPGFFKKALHCINTAQVPPDSTDGYVFDLSVNMHMLRYLQIINSLTRKDLNGALDYMKFKLQSLFSNMQPDGAFKNFARSEKPSVWISSFAMKTLHEILASEWNEQIYIELKLINQVALWITQQQDKHTGVFRETADHYYQRAFWPNSTDEAGTVHQDWHIPVTAYVTIALASATRLTGEAKSATDTAKQLAANYLANKVQKITDPLQMAMTAYALHATNHRSKEDAYAKLKRMARTAEFVYWADKEIEVNPTKIVNTVHYMQSRLDYTNMGYANMATSYALMLYLAHNEFEAARPIMKWLNTQHNKVFTWSSTQDMLLVMQALTEYAFRETNRDIYQIQVTLEATRDSRWKHVVMLNKTNFAQLQQFELPAAWGQIKAYAKGTGYAFIHVAAHHNVEKEYLIGGPKYDAIGFNIDNILFRGRNASIIDVRACARWLRPDIAPVSGQAWVSFEVPTGYTVSRNTILNLYEQKVPGLRHATYRNASLQVSFAYMSQKKTCFEFRMDRWYPVANMSIAHVIWTFEYAEKGLQLQTMYETYSLFHNHICLVCGSYQCPYCPFYNTATSFSTLSPVTMAIVVLAAVYVRWDTRARSWIDLLSAT